MKVFKMNEYDWVAAETIAQAIEWYSKEYGLSWTEDFRDLDPYEVDIDEEFKFYTDFYDDPSKFIITTLRKLLKEDEDNGYPHGVPYVITSTEY